MIGETRYPMFKLTLIAGILFVTTAINFAGFYVSWQRRKARGGQSFAMGMLALTVWTLAAGLDYASVPMAMKIFFAQIEYTGSSAAIACFAVFVLIYTGYEGRLKSLAGRAGLVLLPLISSLLAWTNGLHGWLWTGFRYSEIGDNAAIFEHGPAFAWVIISGYLMVMLIIVSLWQATRHGSSLLRRQASLLLWASLIPVAGNLLYLLQSSEFQGIDWSSITFSIAGILFLTALYGTGLLDLAPIARERLVSSLSDGMIVLDSQNRIIDINQPAMQMIGLPDVNLIGKDLGEIAPLTRAFVQQATEQELTTQIDFGAANESHFDVLISPLYENKMVIGRLIIFRDITERKQAQEALQKANQQLEIQLSEIRALQASLQEQAIRDPLTDLYNRRFLNETITHEFHRAERLKQSLSIGLLDIDRFKAINDMYGHIAGDAYLVMLANLVRQHTRKSDIVCRYGGEEFLLVLPDTTLGSAAQQAEKLRGLCAEAVLEFDGKAIRATISLGVAAYPEHGATYDEIIHKADQALYLSKSGGRDRVTVWAGGA
jgi:diguanylate cyclase (GGDEF)-like protein/PAS domain S-box-containing protein